MRDFNELNKAISTLVKARQLLYHLNHASPDIGDAHGNVQETISRLVDLSNEWEMNAEDQE